MSDPAPADKPADGSTPAGGAAADDVDTQAKKARKAQEIQNKLDLKNFPNLYPIKELERIKLSRREKYEKVISI
jgi:hypothetical protein